MWNVHCSKLMTKLDVTKFLEQDSQNVHSLLMSELDILLNL